MVPTIDRRATGVNIRLIMDSKNISVKDLQNHLGLGSIQSIYHWINGICLPSLDNLYAMSNLFQLPMDDLICGSVPDNYRSGLSEGNSRMCLCNSQLSSLNSSYCRMQCICRFLFSSWEKYILSMFAARFQIRLNFYTNKM